MSETTATVPDRCVCVWMGVCEDNVDGRRGWSCGLESGRCGTVHLYTMNGRTFPAGSSWMCGRRYTMWTGDARA